MHFTNWKHGEKYNHHIILGLVLRITKRSKYRKRKEKISKTICSEVTS